jgi:hypothetical protein
MAADWSEFEALGEDKVRWLLSQNRWGEQRAAMAHHWLQIQASKRASGDNAAILDEARATNRLAEEANASALEANAIAREASESAKRSASAARTSNKIAALALIAAMIAIVVSIIGLMHHP